MMEKRMIEDMERMEDLAARTANSRDNGWQYIYWLSVAVYHILCWIIRKGWTKA